MTEARCRSVACRMALPGALFSMASVVHAQERPVIHSGVEPAGVVEAWLSSEEGLARREVSLPALRSEPGIWVSAGAEGTVCEGTPTDVGDLRQLQESATGLLAYLRVPDARTALGRLESLLACLTEPVDAALAAELFRLRGYADMLGKDADAAGRSFRRALAFDPALAWSEQHNPDFGAALMERLRPTAAVAGVSLTVMPAVEGVVTTVGGRPSETLAIGDRFVQLQGSTTRSMWLTVAEGHPEVVVVVPSALGSDSLQNWAQPGVQDLWRTVVRTSPMQAGPVELIADGHVHLLTPEAVAWETTARLRGGGGGDPIARRRAATAWYGSAGLTILGGGALLLSASNGMVKLEESARSDLLSPDEAEATRTRLNRRVLLGYSLLGAGVGVGGVGALVMRGTSGGGGAMEWVGTW